MNYILEYAWIIVMVLTLPTVHFLFQKLLPSSDQILEKGSTYFAIAIVGLTMIGMVSLSYYLAV